MVLLAAPVAIGLTLPSEERWGELSLIHFHRLWRRWILCQILSKPGRWKTGRVFIIERPRQASMSAIEP